MIGVLVVAAVLLAAAVVFLHSPSFGRLPCGERLARIERSPHFRGGKFRNQHTTPLFTSGRSRIGTMWKVLTSPSPRVRPLKALPVVKTDLRALDPSHDLLVWFGHSSYLMQIAGKRILVDPVLCSASPIPFFNKPFAGTDAYAPDDMPDIDYLIITHDHWDHLDYRTVKRLMDRIDTVVCGLGVGEHFESWGFDPARIVELDWNEQAALSGAFTVHCLPARHFSGRGLTSCRTLWASFLLETPGRKIFIGGDGGYDTHFADIGARFGEIDLAVLENGQYNTDWKYIHLMPDYLLRAAAELKAKRLLTVHHAKYALADHPWDEPLENALKASLADSTDVIIPMIGQPVGLQDTTPPVIVWWR